MAKRKPPIDAPTKLKEVVHEYFFGPVSTTETLRPLRDGTAALQLRQLRLVQQYFLQCRVGRERFLKFVRTTARATLLRTTPLETRLEVWKEIARIEEALKEPDLPLELRALAEGLLDRELLLNLPQRLEKGAKRS